MKVSYESFGSADSIEASVNDSDLASLVNLSIRALWAFDEWDGFFVRYIAREAFAVNAALVDFRLPNAIAIEFTNGFTSMNAWYRVIILSFCGFNDLVSARTNNFRLRVG